MDIARQYGVRKVIKSKSMVPEEAGLNQALAAAGIRPVETDLGEYILQIAGNEPPSHIIAPVMHKNVDQVADLFASTHGTARKTDIPSLTREAREVLREHFVSAEMGISGANFLIAETGSAALVTNEGNGRMVSTLPKVHVVITGIEKIVPTLADLATLMRLLPRSATGQAISNYVSLLTGNGRRSTVAGDPDGPDAVRCASRCLDCRASCASGRPARAGGRAASVSACGCAPGWRHGRHCTRWARASPCAI